MDGMYNETALLQAFSFERGECTLATWNGIGLPSRSRLFAALSVLHTSSKMGLTHASYNLFFCGRFCLRTPRPIHFLPSQTLASEASSCGRLGVLTPACETIGPFRNSDNVDDNDGASCGTHLHLAAVWPMPQQRRTGESRDNMWHKENRSPQTGPKSAKPPKKVSRQSRTGSPRKAVRPERPAPNLPRCRASTWAATSRRTRRA